MSHTCQRAIHSRRFQCRYGEQCRALFQGVHTSIAFVSICAFKRAIGAISGVPVSSYRPVNPKRSTISPNDLLHRGLPSVAPRLSRGPGYLLVALAATWPFCLLRIIA
jgi:hypothetical protein